MNTLEFGEAIGEIADTWRSRRHDDPSPYVFVVGAGVSYPSVPLASEIEKHCKEKAEQKGIKTLPPEDSAMGRYSHWFSKAYPNPHDRQCYLESLIEKKPISVANFRLAHLLLDNVVTNFVVTPNFDDFLSQALTILGRRKFRVCDHPETVDRIDPTGTETQIVHVHGTYWFYDQANLSGEIRSRARGSETTVFSMANLVDSIFLKHSPIVVGYSGWEGDVIMRALKRRLTRRLEYRMYWFCHRRDALELLPSYVKEHQEVWFVLPPESPEVRVLQSPMGKTVSLKDLLTAPPEKFEIPVQLESEFDPRKPEETIDAQMVFGELIAALNVEAPKLLSDPLSFLAEQFQLSMPLESSGSEGAPYSFAGVLTRIRDAQKWEEQGRREKTELLKLSEVQEAVARSLYAEAIQKAQTIRVESLEESQRRELIQSLSFAVKNSASASEEIVLGADLIIGVNDSLPAPVRDDRAVAVALVMKGLTFDELGRSKEEIDSYDEVVRRFGESNDFAIRERVAMALVNKGLTLKQLGRTEDAAGVFDEVVRRFEAEKEPILRQRVALALYVKGQILAELGRREDAIEAYDDLVRRFEESDVSGLRRRVAGALINKALVLSEMQRNEEAIEKCDIVIQRFGADTEIIVQREVARALVNKGVILGEVGQHENAMAAFDEVVSRFGGASEIVLLEGVGRALVNKSVAQRKSGRIEDEIGTLDEIVLRLGEAKEADFPEHVAWALVNKSIALGLLGRHEEAIVVCDEVTRRFGEAEGVGLSVHLALALLNKGSRLSLLGRGEEALQAYSEVEKRFGERSEKRLSELVSLARAEKTKLDAGKN